MTLLESFPKRGLTRDQASRKSSLLTRLVKLRRESFEVASREREERETEETFVGKDVDEFSQTKCSIAAFLASIAQGLSGLARTSFARLSASTSTDKQEEHRENIRQSLAAQEQVRHCMEGVMSARSRPALRRRLQDCKKLEVAYRRVEESEDGERDTATRKAVAEGRSLWQAVERYATVAYVAGQSIQMLEKILANDKFMGGEWGTHSLPTVALGVSKTVAYTASLGMVIFMMDAAARTWMNLCATIGGVVSAYWKRGQPDRAEHEHLPKLTFDGRVGAGAQELVQVSSKSRSAQTFMSTSTVFLVGQVLVVLGVNWLWLVARETFGPVFQVTEFLGTFLQATTRGVGNPLMATVALSFAISGRAKPAVEAFTQRQWSTAMLVGYLPYYGMLEATAVSFANSDIKFDPTTGIATRQGQSWSADFLEQAAAIAANYGERAFPVSLQRYLYDLRMPGMERDECSVPDDLFVAWATEGFVDGTETCSLEEEEIFIKNRRALALKFEGTKKEQYAAVIAEMMPLVSAGQDSAVLGYRDRYGMPQHIHLLRTAPAVNAPVQIASSNDVVMVIGDGDAPQETGSPLVPYTNDFGQVVVWQDPDTAQSYQFADVTRAFEQMPEFMNFVGRTVADNAPLVQKISNRMRYGGLSLYDSLQELRMQSTQKSIVPLLGAVGLNEYAARDVAEAAIARDGPYTIQTDALVKDWRMSRWIAIFNGAVTLEGLREWRETLTQTQDGLLIAVPGAMVFGGSLGAPLAAGVALHLAMEGVKKVITPPDVYGPPNVVDEALREATDVQARFAERPYGEPETVEEFHNTLSLAADVNEWLGQDPQEERKVFLIQAKDFDDDDM